MYVCVCFAVTETEVQEAIESGCENRDAVTRACRAGGDCGSCHGMIDAMLKASEEDMKPGDPIPCERLVRRRGQAA